MELTHFAARGTLLDLQEGLRVFGEVPDSKKGLFDLFERMKADVRADAAPGPSGNAFRKLLKRAMHRSRYGKR